MPGALVDLGAEAAQILRVLGVGMGEAGGAFADALVVVEALAVLFLEFLDVFVLGLWGEEETLVECTGWGYAREMMGGMAYHDCCLDYQGSGTLLGKCG